MDGAKWTIQNLTSYIKIGHQTFWKTVWVTQRERMKSVGLITSLLQARMEGLGKIK